MMLDELLDRLHGSDVELDVDPEGGLVVDAPDELLDDPAVLTAVRAHRELLAASVVGRRTGHGIGVCTHCGTGSLTHYRPASKFPTCRLTPGCPGRHELRPDVVDAFVESGAPKRPTLPRKRTQAGPTTYPRTTSKRSGGVAVLLGPWPEYPTNRARR
jgi:hypothetical protein